MSATLAWLAAAALAPAPVSAPTDAAAPTAAPTAPADPDPDAAAPVATPEDVAPADPSADDGTDPSTTDEAPAEATPEPEPEPEPTPDSDEPDGTLHAAVERAGPPYYDESDMAALRQRYEVPDPAPPREPARWRCLIADPTCKINVEVNATAAYALRFQQGDVRMTGANRWNSGRAQYDVWANFATLVEQEGTAKYTKMTLGPKGGVIFSDNGDMWGNLGMAGRYWLGRGRFAPAIEFSSALAFKLGTRERDIITGEESFQMQRGPVGFTADVGVGIGGFGAVVLGGQYDSPLAREDVPERFRTSAAGMFFVGFRGNILWGGPAAAAILTHGLTQRLVER